MTRMSALRGAAVAVCVVACLVAAGNAATTPTTSKGVSIGGYTYSANIMDGYLALAQDTCNMYTAAAKKNNTLYWDIFYKGQNARDSRGRVMSYAQLLKTAAPGYFYDKLFQGKAGAGGITGWQTPMDLEVFFQEATATGDFEQISHGLTYVVRGKLMTDQLDAAIRYIKRGRVPESIRAIDQAWAMFTGSPFATCANAGYFSEINGWAGAMTYASFLGNSWYEYALSQYFTAAVYGARQNSAALVEQAIASIAAVWTNSGMAFIQSDFYSYDIGLACNNTWMVANVDLFHKAFLNNTIGMLRGFNVSAEWRAKYQAVIIPPSPPKPHYLEVLRVLTDISNSLPAMGQNLWGVPNATAVKAQWAMVAHGRPGYAELPNCTAVPPFTLPAAN